MGQPAMENEELLIFAPIEGTKREIWALQGHHKRLKNKAALFTIRMISLWHCQVEVNKARGILARIYVTSSCTKTQMLPPVEIAETFSSHTVHMHQ